MGWLSEAGDLYVMTMPVETDNPPRFEDIRAGFSELTFQNKRYVASDVRHISLKRAAAQGELGEDPEAVAAFRVLTCRGGFPSGESRRAAFHRVIGLAGGYA